MPAITFSKKMMINCDLLRSDRLKELYFGNQPGEQNEISGKQQVFQMKMILRTQNREITLACRVGEF